MTARVQPALASPRAAALGRGTGFIIIWLLLMPSVQPGDVVIGAGAAVAATVISLRLYAPGAGTLHLGSMLMLMPHFVWQSVLAGFDVALRAFNPRLRLEPGFVRCPLGFPAGLARNTFATITSLMPGTVPCGEIDGTLEYHCLDIRQPVVEQLWVEERLLAHALTAGDHHE